MYFHMCTHLLHNTDCTITVWVRSLVHCAPERRAVPVLRSLLEAMSERDCLGDNCTCLVTKLNFLLTQNPAKEVHIDLWLLLLLPGSQYVYLLASSDLILWKQKKKHKSAIRGGRVGEETTEIIGRAQTICWTLVLERKSQNYLLMASI